MVFSEGAFKGTSRKSECSGGGEPSTTTSNTQHNTCTPQSTRSTRTRPKGVHRVRHVVDHPSHRQQQRLGPVAAVVVAQALGRDAADVELGLCGGRRQQLADDLRAGAAVATSFRAGCVVPLRVRIAALQDRLLSPAFAAPPGAKAAGARCAACGRRTGAAAVMSSPIRPDADLILSRSFISMEWAIAGAWGGSAGRKRAEGW